MALVHAGPRKRTEDKGGERSAEVRELLREVPGLDKRATQQQPGRQTDTQAAMKPQPPISPAST